jgi:putative spermidine/putrescine transport system substrate-binding protein
MRNVSRWLVVLAALALVGAACGDDAGDGGDGTGDGGEPAVVYDQIGEGEGQLKLIAWHGYTEDGTTEGYEEYDWVTPFEDQSGCDVEVTYADSSDEMVQLMRSGGGAEYDGVSASGDASNRLIAGGDVGAVDPQLFPDMANVIGPLNPEGGTNTAHYIVDDNVYGVPYMYGPNFLMYNSEEVSPEPTSWDVTFEADSPYAGKVTAYDSPVFIADALLALDQGVAFALGALLLRHVDHDRQHSRRIPGERRRVQPHRDARSVLAPVLLVHAPRDCMAPQPVHQLASARLPLARG